MRAQPRERSRIVVAVDADDTADLPLDIARHLLRDAATELVGLFVEDRRLFEHAASALAREIGFSGHTRALESATLERQLRARAAEARRRFETRAAELKLPHDFQVVRGDVVAELVREATSAEALVVGLAAHTAPTRAWWARALRELAQAPLPAVLFAREGWQTGKGIVTVVERLADLAASLDTGLRLARRSRSPLTLLLAARAAAERRAAADAAAALAATAGVELRALLTATELTLDTVLRAAHGARLVVLPHGDEPRMADFVTTLVSRTDVPLLVVARREDEHES
jgi:hypothetical protein